MAVLPSNLDSTISVPGFSFSPPLLHPSVRDLDINQIPAGAEEEWITASGEDESSNGGGLPRKKLRLTKEQSRLLEENFRLHCALNPKHKEALAMQLQLRPRQVEVWFQNRRARSKFKQKEIECEYLKRWFGSLTEQNRRLEKEVNELRAMKVGPPTVLSPHSSEPSAASTLTMCPRCECVTTTATTTATSKVGTLSLQSRPSSAAC